MSRQINYFMDEKTEFEFIQFVIKNNFVFIRWTDGKIVNPYEDKSLYFFITKESYLPFLKFRNNSVDVLSCLVIEYSRNNIIDDKKVITKGRIYISDAYKEKEYSAFMDDFIKDYIKLSRWIKKNVPYQNYTNMGKKQKEYISDSMLFYSEQNYCFRS